MIWSILALTAVTAALLPERQTGNEEPTRYTQCGADRGYTEADSLLAAKYLTETIIKSDRHPLASQECIHATVNTTIIMMCNTASRNRTITRGEARRGINQLIKDCGLDGGFTGTHFVNNLTFSAWGVAGITYVPPSRGPKALVARNLVPGLVEDKEGHRLAKRDCQIAYDGVLHYDCKKINTIDPATGKCTAELKPENSCQAFCEISRAGMWGHEQRLPGAGGQQYPKGQSAEIQTNTAVEVSHSFQIAVEGVVKEVIGLGVGYQWSIAKTEGIAVTRKANENSTDWFSRWVYLPKQIQSCGQIVRNSVNGGGNCNGDACTPSPPTCQGEPEYIDNVCSIVPRLNPDGTPDITYLMRYEDEYGNPVGREGQSQSYLGLCGDADLDKDPEFECYTYIPS